MPALGTNVLVRCLVQDDGGQFAAAKRLIDRCVAEGRSLLVAVTVTLCRPATAAACPGWPGRRRLQARSRDKRPGVQARHRDGHDYMPEKRSAPDILSRELQSRADRQGHRFSSVEASCRPPRGASSDLWVASGTRSGTVAQGASRREAQDGHTRADVAPLNRPWRCQCAEHA